MKKSTGVILVLIIVLLLGVIGVGGYFFIKGNNDTDKEIGELKNEVANLGKNTENTSNNQVTNDVQTNTTDTTPISSQTTTSNAQLTKTMNEIAGKYTCEIKDDSGYTWATNLYLADDGTFGCFGETGGNTGSYSIEGNKIILNVIFSHEGGVGLNLVKEQKTLILKEDGSLETKDIYVHEKAPKTITLKKVSNSASDFDIRTNIRGSIGTGPEYYFTYNY